MQCKSDQYRHLISDEGEASKTHEGHVILGGNVSRTQQAVREAWVGLACLLVELAVQCFLV